MSDANFMEKVKLKDNESEKIWKMKKWSELNERGMKEEKWNIG